MTAFLALTSALIIGAADFGGGLASRQAPTMRVTAWIQTASLMLVVVAVWFIDAPTVTTTDVVAGVVAGLAGSFSFICLYTAFTMGQISLLAPTTAIVSAVVPTMVGVARGESIGWIQACGIVLALVAIALVTQERAEPGDPQATPPAAFGLALIAGVGFSIFFLALAETDSDSGLWPLLVARLTSVPLVGVMALVFTGGLLVNRTVGRICLAAGITEMVANILILWAYQRGPLAVAAVLGAFFPVSTVLLARIVFDEDLRRVQWTGVGLALLSVPLVALP